jgi:iron(II)-dependent oxidoreductase
MGVDKSLWIDDATPKRKVFISSFYLDKFEVNFEEYQRCVNDSKCKPSKYAKKSKFNKSLLPVIGVNWPDAKVFCEWLGKRLPTEAEWEKSARGAEERKYTWGEKFSIYASEKFANVYGKYDDFFLTAPVDSFPNGASPYGIFNMNGNVREWVSDWYDPEYYRERADKDPQGPDDGKYKVVRGGSYKNTPPKISNTYRDYEKPTKATKDVGFRCALSE